MMMAEAMEDQLQLQVAEAGLKAIATVDMSPANGDATSSTSSSENDNHFDSNRDEEVSSEDAISNIMKFEDGEVIEAGESSKAVGEVVEEEIVELEFEKVKPKLETHSMHCPNCKSEISKVILRRKLIKQRQPEPVEQPIDDRHDLVGCFSCLSLFTCSENGCFNPFDIFRKRRDPIEVTPSPPTGEENTKLLVQEQGNCLSMLWVLGKKQKEPKQENPSEAEPESNSVDVNYETGASYPPQTPKYVTGITSIAKGDDDNREDSKKRPLLGASRPDHLSSSNVAGLLDSTIVDLPEPENIVAVDAPARATGRSWVGYERVLVEILKSIVYGGLMEVIASLSVVTSAAASDTSTLSIVALALASVIGGIFMIGNNIWDLRNDCYKNKSSEETKKEATNKYQELLGRVNYFPLHAIFAILSFIIFGIIPPLAYGFSFRETNDKDFTVVAVATSALLCVAILAIFKAYINKCTFLDYFKTVVYYITWAIAASGVSYVAGNLVTRLMEELGLFDTSSGGGPSFVSF